MTFLGDDNPNYSKSDGELMQLALEDAAKRLNITDMTNPEFGTLARFVRAAFIIGNRDSEAMAKFAVNAVLTRRRRTSRNKPAPWVDLPDRAFPPGPPRFTTERSTAELDVAVAAVAMLQRLGHLVYLDDFGTGYWSLANLQQLNVDTIKIDRAFTGTVGTASVKVSIVPQILDLADALKLGVIVEGIETEEQRDYFAAADVSYAGQGWFISPPLTFAQLVIFHKERRGL